MKNNFIWCDLSTFDIKRAQRFYSELFGWSYVSMSDRSMKSEYLVAHQKENAVSALFVMPEYLQKINMPSFWMSYVQVENIENTVENAKKHDGVIIEIEPTQFDEKSKIALIRDPSGAGFTVYEGPDLDGRYENGHGRMVWNVHHVSDVGRIKKFYEDVFGWVIKKQRGQEHVYDIATSDGSPVATIEEMDESVTGKFQYWMPIFEVGSQAEIQKKVKKLGGSILAEFKDGRTIYADDQGGSFMCRELKHVARNIKKDSRIVGLKTVVALMIIWTAILLDMQWVWGIFFLWMLLPDLKRGSTYFVEYITRDLNPLVYWLTMGSWMIMIVYLLTAS